MLTGKKEAQGSFLHCAWGLVWEVQPLARQGAKGTGDRPGRAEAATPEGPACGPLARPPGNELQSRLTSY